MASETSKSMRRRWCEDELGIFPWREIFDVKVALDVGAGDDPLQVPYGCETFDKANGDANRLSKYFQPKSLQLIHASQCLEHMNDPAASLRDWLSLVQSGGHLVFTVPDLGSFENFRYPSRFNNDHKASFSMLYKASAFPKHFHIPTLLKQVSFIAEVRLARYIEANYDWKIDRDVDQTWEETAGVELWNEVVLRKK